MKFPPQPAKEGTMKTRICPNCSKEIPEATSKCEHCKAEFEPKKPPSPQKQRLSRLARAVWWMAVGAIFCGCLVFLSLFLTETLSFPMPRWVEPVFFFFAAAFLFLTLGGGALSLLLLIWYSLRKKPIERGRVLEGFVISAVILVLAAILLPTCAKARESARRAGPYSMSLSEFGIESWEMAGSVDEVWVIERPGITEEVPSADKPAEKPPTQGELHALVGNKEVPVPLEHTDVKARVSGFLATVDVTQKFHNPYDTKIEAEYVFPLPQNAAVTDFLMTVGERRILGLIREREEAEEMYERARSQGYVASLLTQERPNIFTQKVANIEPGKRVDVQITYFDPLPYHDGEYEFVFPMVVGPRFNPPGMTDGIGAVARGSGGISGQATEVQYLKPGERSGHDIALSLDIDAGVEIEDIYSRTHAVDVKRLNPSRVQVALRPNDSIPNRDFVLRYKVAGDEPKTAMMVNRGENGGTFALLLQPPKDMQNLPRVGREMVFVVDCSGSMSGEPLAKAKAAMRRCLRKLDPADTFQIIRFSENASSLGGAPIPATPKNVRQGLAYLESLNSGGGTMMIEGIKAALDFPHDAERLRIVSFMTDGYIGNEAEIFKAVDEKIGSARLFSFGVGSSVNRYLLDGLAKMGRGAVAYVNLNDPATDAVDLFYERAAHPALADISVDWGELAVSDVYPRRLPDLFVGRPVLVTGRFEGNRPTTIRISGLAGGERRTISLDVDPTMDEAEHAGIESVWARWKIADLSDREILERSPEIKQQIIDTSLTYRVLTAYTAFVAVDESERTAGEEGVQVAVPVPVPEGVRYETTVQEE
jgi:Ca-activated chloride channel family protein